ncbi:MAG: hypothetical protein HC800_03690 [Phormidesmis sp. RL_2_1]|nr:hypothetical protein [Phormidesmis sp. RL_2_1]
MADIPFAALVTLLYGILAIVGGTIGYRQAGSKVSLISGVISGFLLLVAAYLLWGGAAVGPLLSAIISLILIVVFAIRWFKTRKFMPAGLMIMVGVVNLATLWLTLPIN